MARVRALTGEVELKLDRWEMALSPAGAVAGPREAAALSDWIAACAPGTAAAALETVGGWGRHAAAALHDKDVWWRTVLPAGGPRRLVFEGLATLVEAWSDEQPLFTSRSMFIPQEVSLPASDQRVLWICCRALAPALAAKSPRARWRPRMIEAQGLRRVRTTLLGHMPGWRPRIDVVGPWREARLIAEGPVRLTDVSLRPQLAEDGPRLRAELRMEGATLAPILSCAGVEVRLEPAGPGRFGGELRAPGAGLWCPHTHGAPILHEVKLEVGQTQVDLGRTGFRRIEADRGSDGQGFGLRVNGVSVFCRGAVWVNPGVASFAGGRDDCAPALRRMRDAGMNMVRVSGVGVYETPAFYELCDELGLMVWQDFMFANFDYPAVDADFVADVRAEADALLSNLEASPSLAVLCGGCEVMQQAAMMGLSTEELSWPLFDEILAEAAARRRPDVPYLPNTPWGGAPPFEARRGVTHYYGVGAYLRPLEDARRAEVRFAAECLGFANVPEAESLAGVLDVTALNDPHWKARTPRDRGASWDFEDVRDHYFAHLFGLDPAQVRREDPELYLDLSRAVTGEAMAAVFAEWRRARSPCRGGLVWMLQDAQVGAGWGIIDAAGRPKAPWWALKRVLRPLQVLLTDEGVNGLAVHLINEAAEPFRGELRLTVHGETPGPLIDTRHPVALAPREAVERTASELIGPFFDLTYAYRFGPLGHTAVSAELSSLDGRPVSRAIYLPPGVRGWEPAGAVAAELAETEEGWALRLCAERLQRFVRLADPAFEADDDWIVLLPGEARVINLSPRLEASKRARPDGEARAPGGRVIARWRG